MKTYQLDEILQVVLLSNTEKEGRSVCTTSNIEV